MNGYYPGNQGAARCFNYIMKHLHLIFCKAMKNLKNASIALLLAGLIAACSSTRTGTGAGV